VSPVRYEQGFISKKTEFFIVTVEKASYNLIICLGFFVVLKGKIYPTFMILFTFIAVPFCLRDCIILLSIDRHVFTAVRRSLQNYRLVCFGVCILVGKGNATKTRIIPN
jgi:hypothetical protein